MTEDWHTKFRNDIKAIPTEYNGTKFKSRLEANTAYFFDNMNWEWKYEPQSYLLPNGQHFWPDFYLPKLNVWAEVKGDDRFYPFIWSEKCNLFKKMVTSVREEFIVISNTCVMMLDSWGFTTIKSNVCNQSSSTLSPGINVWVGPCPKCNEFTPTTDIGFWFCRVCKQLTGKPYRFGKPILNVIKNGWDKNENNKQ